MRRGDRAVIGETAEPRFLDGDGAAVRRRQPRELCARLAAAEDAFFAEAERLLTLLVLPV